VKAYGVHLFIVPSLGVHYKVTETQKWLLKVLNPPRELNFDIYSKPLRSRKACGVYHGMYLEVGAIYVVVGARTLLDKAVTH
jgi:hypothetical protein